MFAPQTLHPLDFLTEEDYQELRLSGLTDEQIVRAGHFSIADRAEGRQLADINHRGLAFRYLNPVSGEPYRTPKGKPFHRMKPRDWSDSWTSPIEQPPKYLSPTGSGNKPYFSALQEHFNAYAKKPTFPVFIVEGEKKADCLTAKGFFTIGLAGVYGWLDREARGEEVDIPPAQTIEDDELADEKLPESRMLPELVEIIDWHYRHTNIVFDSDASSKSQVRAAMQDLAVALKDLKADPHIIRLPNEIDGSKNGPDDFLVRHGLAAFKFLEKIAKPAFKKKSSTQLDFPKEPDLYAKIIMAWSVLKEHWRYRPGVGWYQWQENHWVPRPDREFKEDMIRFQDAQGWEIATSQDVILKQLECRLLIRNEAWNQPGLMAFTNGTLNCQTGEFEAEHRREHFLTSVLPYEYTPQANCPTWLKFLNEALQGDQEGIALLQAFTKWVLLPKDKNKKAEIEKCLDLVGPKGSGKGTFLDALIALVGAENVGAIGTETFKSPCYLSGLLDKKLSVDTDAFGYLANVGLFNQVVSNEPVMTKILYTDPITTRLGTVIVRAYNRVLEVPDGSEGLDRRIIAIAFNHQPEEIDLGLSDQIQAELPGIFAWAWQLPQAEMKRRLVWAGAVKSVQEASLKRFEANNPEYSFLAETFPDGNPRVKAGDLYSSYVEWSKNSGLSPKKIRKFVEAIQGLGCEKSRKIDGCFFYTIPSMEQFDPIGHLGLRKKIKISPPEVLPPQLSLSSLSQSQQGFQDRESLNSTLPTPSTLPDCPAITPVTLSCDNTFLNQPSQTELLQQHVREDTPFREGVGRVENQSSLPSNPVPERLRESRESLAGKPSGIKNFDSEQTPCWTKAVFAVVKSEEPQPPIELTFPYLGCEVNKIVGGERKASWVGFIREINGQDIKVWWLCDWHLNRNNKPIKDKDGLPTEKWSLCRLDELCPRPEDEIKQTRRSTDIAARNQTYIDQAIRRHKALHAAEQGKTVVSNRQEG